MHCLVVLLCCFFLCPHYEFSRLAVVIEFAAGRVVLCSLALCRPCCELGDYTEVSAGSSRGNYCSTVNMRILPQWFCECFSMLTFYVILRVDVGGNLVM